MKNPIGKAANRVIDKMMSRVVSQEEFIERTSPSTKMALKRLYMDYRIMVAKGQRLPPVWDTGFRIFSQFDEDGIIIFLLGAIGIGPGKFVDVGGGDGISGSNCANLALNLGFHGLIVDANHESIERGKEFYENHPDTFLYPPTFTCAVVKRSNINQITRDAGFESEIDLLSIDIDGNDYWIWDAVECISPRIVLIETNVKFGMRSIVVPYDEDYIYPGTHSQYLGASPVAMTKLARKLGYRLVGANRFGFNVFYVRDDLGRDTIPEIETSELFKHDAHKEWAKLFKEIEDFDYEIV